MWVLHICHSYYPPFLDCARQYCALFKGTPYKVLTVYLTGKKDQGVAAQTESDEVIFLGYESKQVRGLKLGAIARVKEITKSRDFLFCIAHRVKPTYVALLGTKLPIVSVHHNYDDYKRWSRHLLVNLFKKRILMIGVSNDVRDDLRTDLKHWDDASIQTLYNHINVDKVKSSLKDKGDARKDLGIPTDAYVIANVGRLHYDKDQATLIRGFAHALPQLPENSILYIAGKGPLESQLKQLVVDLQVEKHVCFAGHVADIRTNFKAFDLFALTSDREPFGMVLLEAMAAELPIICSDCGGGAEVVKDVGYLFNFGDMFALSKVMIAVSKGANPLDKSNINHELNKQFSDDAVKQRFWTLPFISTLVEQ